MSNLLINESPLMVLPSLAKKIGLNEAIVLQQVHYWLNPKINKNIKEDRHWVHNSYEQWQTQFPFWPIITIKRTIQSLEKQEFLISSNFNGSSFNKTKWYTINYKKLNDGSDCTHRSDQNDPSIGSIRSMDEIKMIPSNIDTEITTEITSPLTPQRGEEKKIKNKTAEKPLFSDTSQLEEMVKIWNHFIQEGQGISPSLSSRALKLKKAFDHFGGDLKNWERYCQKIASSKFLMGETKENFSIKIDWAIKEETIEKIMDGSFTTGDRAGEIIYSLEDDRWSKARKIYDTLSLQKLEHYKELYVQKYPDKIVSENHLKQFIVEEIMKEFF